MSTTEDQQMDEVEPLSEPQAANDEQQSPAVPARRPALGALLIAEGLVTKEQLYGALAEGTRTGERLGEVLIRRALASEEDVARVLSEQFELPYLAPGSFSADPAAKELLSVDEARRLEACAVGFENDVPLVAVADPNDARFNSLRQSLGEEIRFAVVTGATLNELLGHEPSAEAPAEPSPEVVDEFEPAPLEDGSQIDAPDFDAAPAPPDESFETDRVDLDAAPASAEEPAGADGDHGHGHDLELEPASTDDADPAPSADTEPDPAAVDPEPEPEEFDPIAELSPPRQEAMVARAEVDGGSAGLDPEAVLAEFDGVTEALRASAERLALLRIRLERFVEASGETYRELDLCRRRLDADQVEREHDREKIGQLEEQLARRTQAVAELKSKLGDVMSDLAEVG